AWFCKKDGSADVANLDCAIVANESVVCLVPVANHILSSFNFPRIVLFRWVHSAVGLPQVRLEGDVGSLVLDLIQCVTQQLERFVMRTSGWCLLVTSQKLCEAF